jgi:hypothetical protein
LDLARPEYPAPVDDDLEVLPFVVDDDVVRIVQVHDLVRLHPRYPRRVEYPLVLPRTERHHPLDHDRFQLLSLDQPPQHQARVDGGGGPRRLAEGGLHEEGVDPVEIGVDHERRATPQVDVLLPPIRDVVGGPPRLEPEVSLELLADAVLELGGELLHALVIGVVEERSDAPQVLETRSTVADAPARLGTALLTLVMVSCRLGRGNLGSEPWKL